MKYGVKKSGGVPANETSAKISEYASPLRRRYTDTEWL